MQIEKVNYLIWYISSLTSYLGYRRCIRRSKPFLTLENCQIRLAFAHEMLRLYNIDQNHFDYIIYTDECAINTGYRRYRYCTRRLDQIYDHNKLQPKFKKIPKCSYWGAISGRGAEFLGYITDLGNLTGELYGEHILPVINRLATETGYFVVEDNATIHNAEAIIPIR